MKMLSKMAWAQRPSGLIKSRGKHKCFYREATLIKVDNVSLKQIMIIDLNHCPIIII
jgi:hypothetical protein